MFWAVSVMEVLGLEKCFRSRIGIGVEFDSCVYRFVFGFFITK